MQWAAIVLCSVSFLFFVLTARAERRRRGLIPLFFAALLSFLIVLFMWGISRNFSD